MQILILGATGRTGTLVLLEALRRDHTVTALVRKPSSLETLTSTIPAAQKSQLTLVTGSPLSAADVAGAVATASSSSSSSPSPSGPDNNSKLVVISTLNPRRTSENPWAAPHPTDSPPRMMADSIANVLAALSAGPSSPGAGGDGNTGQKPKTKPRPKIVHVSALGVGTSAASAHWLVQGMISHSNVQLAYDDHEAVEAELRGAEGGRGIVDWVFVRPGRLTEGDDGGRAVVWPAERGMVGMMAKASRGAVARFVVDAAEGSEWDGKGPVVLS